MYKILPFLTLLLFFASCTSDRLIDDKADITNSEWSYDNIPAFPFLIEDTDVCYNVFVNLQVNEEYLYRNIYLKVHLRDPDGKDIENRVSLDLTTPEGKWLGSGSGSFKSFQLPISTDLCLEKTGNYVIGLEQNMRDSVLKNVNYAGIAITKGNPKF